MIELVGEDCVSGMLDASLVRISTPSSVITYLRELILRCFDSLAGLGLAVMRETRGARGGVTMRNREDPVMACLLKTRLLKRALSSSTYAAYFYKVCISNGSSFFLAKFGHHFHSAICFFITLVISAICYNLNSKYTAGGQKSVT